jgi:hypothetical protein
VSPVLHLRVAGVLLLLLAALHPFMPARFRWKEELARLSLLNRQIFLVHVFFIGLVLVMMGALCAFAPELLVARGPLARLVLGAFAFFWLARLATQWLVYDRSLWRGQPFNTFVHGAFTLLWLYLVAVYGSLFWLQSR